MGKLSVFWKLIIGEIITLSVLWKCGQSLFRELIICRAWVSMGAMGAWYPLNFWTVMSGTRWFWQFYYIMLCFTLEFWGITSDWHPLFQISNSSPVNITWLANKKVTNWKGSVTVALQCFDRDYFSFVNFGNLFILFTFIIT